MKWISFSPSRTQTKKKINELEIFSEFVKNTFLDKNNSKNMAHIFFIQYFIKIFIGNTVVNISGLTTVNWNG